MRTTIALALTLASCGGQLDIDSTEQTPQPIVANCEPETLVKVAPTECVVLRGAVRLSSIGATGCALNYYEYTCIALQVDSFVQGEFTVETSNRAANGTCNLCYGKVGTYQQATPRGQNSN